MNGAKDDPIQVGVLGATSFVGASLLNKLTKTEFHPIAYTRRDIKFGTKNIEWRRLDSELSASQKLASLTPIPFWFCLVPIAQLPNYFDLMRAHGAKRLVALSSTSRFTKLTSSDLAEQIHVRNVADAEQRVEQWAQRHGIEWTILRPTLIYGSGQDRNIAEITRFIQRFGFFPVFGKACGLRQPLHVQDVARACMASLHAPASINRAYNISGAETLTYREMVCRIFTVLEKKPRLLPIPLWMFRVAVYVLRHLPRYSKWSSAMAERMNYDMVFDHSDVVRDFEFKPRTFILNPEDLPN